MHIKQYAKLSVLTALLFAGGCMRAASDEQGGGKNGFFAGIFTGENLKKAGLVFGGLLVVVGGISYLASPDTNATLNPAFVSSVLSSEDVAFPIPGFGAGKKRLAKEVADWLFPLAQHPLGYEPNTDKIKDFSNVGDGVSHHPLIIALHGYGDDKWDIRDRITCLLRLAEAGVDSEDSEAQKIIRDREPSDRISYMSFDFPDSTNKGWLRFARTNLGAAVDTLAAVWHVCEAYRKGYRKIVILGHSRGGATGISLAHVFMFPDKYKDVWEKLGLLEENGDLDSALIAKIWQSVDSLFLINPLLNVAKIKILEGAFSGFLKVMMSLLTNINFSEMTHVQKLQELFKSSACHLPLIKIWLAEDDEVVGNASDDEVLKLAKSQDDEKTKGKLTVTMVPGNVHTYSYRLYEGADVKTGEFCGHCDLRFGIFGLCDYVNELCKASVAEEELALKEQEGNTADEKRIAVKKKHTRENKKEKTEDFNTEIAIEGLNKLSKTMTALLSDQENLENSVVEKDEKKQKKEAPNLKLKEVAVYKPRNLDKDGFTLEKNEELFDHRGLSSENKFQPLASKIGGNAGEKDLVPKGTNNNFI